jgi:hypothetical protein
VITKLSPSAVLHLPSALALAASLLVPPVAPAQEDSARLAGIVTSSSNGQPLAGVTVALRGTQVFDVSNTAGAFTLAGLPSGKQTVRIRFGDSASYSYDRTITLRPAETLTLAVLLDVAAADLEPIVVEANTWPAERSLAGFYDRKRSGVGRYYTLEEIERRHLTSLSALLLEGGVRVRCGPGVQCLPLGWANGRVCLMPLFYNGMRLASQDLAEIHLDTVAGVEVYNRGLDVPHKFRGAWNDDCGVVLLWSR